jgi:hypothetical protein
MTRAAHTTQLFQQLDISLFGVLNRRGQDTLPFDDDQGTTDFLFKVYRTFKQIMIEANIFFQAVGFGFDAHAELYRVLFIKKN